MAEQSPTWMYLNQVNFYNWTVQLLSCMCVSVFCFVFCFCFCSHENLMSSAFVSIANDFFKTHYWNGPRIKGFEHVGGFLLLTTKFLSKQKSGFVGFFSSLHFPSRLRRGTRGHTSRSLKFLEDIDCLFLRGNVSRSPPPRMPCPVIYSRPEPARLPQTVFAGCRSTERSKTCRVIWPQSKHRGTVAGLFCFPRNMLLS